MMVDSPERSAVMEANADQEEKSHTVAGTSSPDGCNSTFLTCSTGGERKRKRTGSSTGVEPDQPPKKMSKVDDTDAVV